MTVRVHHWDAFTRRPGKGNPAGIVLSAQSLGDADMQSIARTIGFNDTAFVLPARIAEFRLKFFSPQREVDLCGHATIAAFSALHRQQLLRHDIGADEFTLETKAGILKIGIEISEEGDLMIAMNQCESQFSPFNGARQKMAVALGIAPTDFHDTLPVIYGSTGRWTLVVPVKDLRVMQKMRPIPAEFAAVLEDMPDASIHPFALETIDPRAAMHARHLSVRGSETLEDAVTGTASGVLGAYYRSFILGRAEFNRSLIIEQGYELGREGTVQVWAIKVGENYAVRIAGTACFVRDIDIDIDIDVD